VHGALSSQFKHGRGRQTVRISSAPSCSRLNIHQHDIAAAANIFLQVRSGFYLFIGASSVRGGFGTLKRGNSSAVPLLFRRYGRAALDDCPAPRHLDGHINSCRLVSVLLATVGFHALSHAIRVRGDIATAVCATFRAWRYILANWEHRLLPAWAAVCIRLLRL